MGTDKALLRTPNGETWEQRGLNVLRESGCDHLLLSSNREGGLHDDQDLKDLGPMGGMVSTLRRVPDGDIVVFLPVDVVKIEAQDLKQLFDEMAKDPFLNAVYFEGNPLPAVVRSGVQVMESAQKSIIAKDYAIKSWVGRIQSKGIFLINSEGSNQTERLSNFNSPEDLKYYER